MAMKFSTRLIRKGALVHETRAILKTWDEDKELSANLSVSFADDLLGVRSSAWLREIRVTLSSRFSEFSGQELTSLVLLAKSPVENDVWKSCLHYHCGKMDQLYYCYATEWLYNHFHEGTYRLRSVDLEPFIAASFQALKHDKSISEYGRLRAARDLLRMSTDFGLLTGNVLKEFSQFHIPDEGFLYVLHSLSENEANAGRMINSAVWRLFLMSAADVEREILRLHQFRKLDYQVAGSIVQLKLPYSSASEYVKELTNDGMER